MAQVLFVGGLGRSGTTLIERVLAELPQVCALGEVVHLWQRDVRDDERCGCGERFSACDFWSAVGDTAFSGWDRLDVGRILALQATVERTRYIPRLAGRPIPYWRAHVAEYADYYAAVYRAAAKVSGARVVVDSSKHSALAHCLRWSDGLDLRVLHVVRDPRGVAYSWTKTVPRPEADGADEMTRYSPARSAALWNAHNAAFGLLARRGVPVLRVRYEDFLADPRQTVREIAAFAGLDTTANPLHFLDAGHVDLRPGHSAAGNPMRFTTGRLSLRSDEAWRRALPRDHRAVVTTICAPLLLAYRYPLRTGRGPGGDAVTSGDPLVAADPAPGGDPAKELQR